MGKVVCAFVVLRGAIFRKDLINWAKSKLTRYKCPKRVIFINHNQCLEMQLVKYCKELKIMIKNTKIMSKDLNTDNNSVASWIVKFLVKEK